MRPLEEQSMLEAILRGLPSRFEAGDAAARTGADGDGARLALSRLGSFGHGVLWIGPPAEEPRAPPARAFAHRLAGEIRARLRAARIDFDDRPLKLHATLVRGAKTFGRHRNAGDSGDAEAREPAPRTVVARTWSLALGASGPDSTPLRRYRWSHPRSGQTGAM